MKSTLCNWLKKLAPLSQTVGIKTKPIVTWFLFFFFSFSHNSAFYLAAPKLERTKKLQRAQNPLRNTGYASYHLLAWVFSRLAPFTPICLEFWLVRCVFASVVIRQSDWLLWFQCYTDNRSFMDKNTLFASVVIAQRYFGFTTPYWNPIYTEFESLGLN